VRLERVTELNSGDAHHPQGTYRTLVEGLLDDMGLSEDELNLPSSFGTTLTSHRSTQLVDESPLVAIAKILFVSGQLPRFDGDGRLSITDGQVTKAPVRVYANDEIILRTRIHEVHARATAKWRGTC
jgi:hypothetical protein